MSIKNTFIAVGSWWNRVRFSRVKRIEFYRDLNTLMRNGIKQVTALERLNAIYSSNGQDKNNVLSILTSDCLKKVSSSESISDSLTCWVPKQEIRMIKVGEDVGMVIDSFVNIVETINSENKIENSLIKYYIYPFTLLLITASFLYVLNGVLNVN